MLVFIDDSGDPGFQIDRGSSTFFVITLIIFDDELEAEKASVRIKELRRALRFPDEVEFKFNKSSRRVREQFLRAVRPCVFRIGSVVVDKGRLRHHPMRTNTTSFYRSVISAALERSAGVLVEAKVRIDGSAERVFRRNFLRSLQQHTAAGHLPMIRDCKLVRSKGSVLIQLADLVAGAVRRSYDDTKTDRLVYKAIIQQHIEDEWMLTQ